MHTTHLVIICSSNLNNFQMTKLAANLTYFSFLMFTFLPYFLNCWPNNLAQTTKNWAVGLLLSSLPRILPIYSLCLLCLWTTHTAPIIVWVCVFYLHITFSTLFCCQPKILVAHLSIPTHIVKNKPHLLFPSETYS